MATVLEEALSFIGTSIAGGVTWDILRGSGLKLFNSFKDNFYDKGYFNSEQEIENFIEDLVIREIYNQKNPFKDICGIHEKVTNLDNSKMFAEDFKLWLERNKHAFEGKDYNSIQQSAVINIYGTQSASKGGKIINIGNSVKI